MPAILYALGALLVTLARQYLPGIVGRVLLTFGIGLATYKVALPSLLSMLSSQLSLLPPVARSYAGAIGLDVAAVMVISAFASVRLQRVFLSKLSTS